MGYYLLFLGEKMSSCNTANLKFGILAHKSSKKEITVIHIKRDEGMN